MENAFFLLFVFFQLGIGVPGLYQGGIVPGQGEYTADVFHYISDISLVKRHLKNIISHRFWWPRSFARRGYRIPNL